MPIGDCAMANELHPASGLEFGAFHPAHPKPGAWLKSASAPTLIEGQGCEVHSFNYESRRGKFGSIVALEDLGALLQEVCQPDRFRS